MRVVSIFAVVATISCSGATQDNTVPAGTWGGPDVLVTTTKQGATTQFVCAHGTIDRPIVPDGSGNFSAGGTYVYEHPAGITGQPSSDSHAARYDGQFVGATLRITVTIPDTQQTVGPLTATFGATGPASRC